MKPILIFSVVGEVVLPCHRTDVKPSVQLAAMEVFRYIEKVHIVSESSCEDWPSLLEIGVSMYSAEDRSVDVSVNP